LHKLASNVTLKPYFSNFSVNLKGVDICGEFTGTGATCGATELSYRVFLSLSFIAATVLFVYTLKYVVGVCSLISTFVQ
jgi:hypothetical protein